MVFGAKQMCQGGMNLVMELVGAMASFYGDVMQGLIEFIVNRPRAMRNGNPTITGQPTNAPMDQIRTVWETKGLPAGVGLWMLFMLLNEFRGLAPGGKRSEYSKAEMHVRGWITLGFIIGSWQIAMVLLHLAHALAMFFAPDASMLAGDLQVIQGTGAGAVIAAILIFVFGGFIAILAVIEFLAAYLGVFIVVPFLPVMMALTMPDFWIFDRLQAVGKTLMAMVIPTIFFTVPTAAVLSVGYTVSNALATATPDLLSFIPGVQIGVVAVMGILQLITWLVAMIAPLGMWLMSSQSKVGAGILAGAISAASIGSLSSGRSRTPSGSDGAPAPDIPPLDPPPTPDDRGPPTPNDRDTPTPRGDGTPTPGGRGPPTPSGQGTPTPGDRGGPEPSGIPVPGGKGKGNGTPTPAGASPGSAAPSGQAASDPTVTEVYDPTGFDTGRSYEIGRMSDGEFDRQVPHTMDGDALVNEGRFRRLDESKHFSDRDLVLRDPETGEIYDVNPIAQRDGAYDTVADVTEQQRTSRNAVHDTKEF